MPLTFQRISTGFECGESTRQCRGRDPEGRHHSNPALRSSLMREVEQVHLNAPKDTQARLNAPPWATQDRRGRDPAGSPADINQQSSLRLFAPSIVPLLRRGGFRKSARPSPMSKGSRNPLWGGRLIRSAHGLGQVRQARRASSFPLVGQVRAASLARGAFLQPRARPGTARRACASRVTLPAGRSRRIMQPTVATSHVTSQPGGSSRIRGSLARNLGPRGPRMRVCRL